MPPETGAAASDDLRQRLETVRREHERLVARLRAGERRYRRLARSVWSVQEAERRRLARELHDGVGQLLTALKQQLELARAEGSEAGRRRLDDALGLATQALADTRELSRLLRPAVLDDLGLEAGLGWLARTHQERTGTRVELALHGLAGRFDDELETLVFRVVQEALTNAAKHARASEIRVVVTREPEALSLEVADDGAGFDPRELTEGRDGLGLLGMKDRLDLFEGRLEVRSAPGAGTVVAARIPLEVEP